MSDTSREVSTPAKMLDGNSPAALAAINGSVEAMVQLFKVLGDRTRLSILLLLAEGERNVGTLCEELDLPQPTVSHHLGLMRINRLIDNRRDGKQVFYTLAHGVSANGDGVHIVFDRHVVHLRPNT